MASIIQGTDGDVVVSIGNDLDLNTVEWFSVRIVQGSLYIEKTKDDLFLDFDNKEIHVPISKEESMRFSATAANLQVLYGLEGSSKTRGTYTVPFRIYPLLQPAPVEDEEESGGSSDSGTDNTDSSTDTTDGTVDTLDSTEDSTDDTGNGDAGNG